MILPSEAALLNFSTQLMAGCAKFPTGILLVEGELGAGKTTLVRGLLHALGFRQAVKSPTYTLVETYTINGLTIHHFDLYRLRDAEELHHIGFSEYLLSAAWNIIEWPERAGDWLRDYDLLCVIDFFPFSEDPLQQQRHLQLQAGSAQGERILASMLYNPLR